MAETTEEREPVYHGDHVGLYIRAGVYFPLARIRASNHWRADGSPVLPTDRIGRCTACGEDAPSITRRAGILVMETSGA